MASKRTGTELLLAGGAIVAGLLIMSTAKKAPKKKAPSEVPQLPFAAVVDVDEGLMCTLTGIPGTTDGARETCSQIYVPPASPGSVATVRGVHEGSQAERDTVSWVAQLFADNGWQVQVLWMLPADQVPGNPTGPFVPEPGQPQAPSGPIYADPVQPGVMPSGGASPVMPAQPSGSGFGSSRTRRR